MDTGRLVVIGNGMVGQELLASLVRSGAADRWSTTVLGEEPRTAYDRVQLSACFTGASPEDLSLCGPEVTDHPGIELVVGTRVTGIDRSAKVVTTSTGRAVTYDALVLATGSAPFIPPIPGGDGPGCFAYRTIEDLEAIRAHAADCGTGVVIGGGLLGLEAANALRALGLETHVVEFAPRLMPVQVDPPAGEILRAHVEALGIGVHTGMATTEIVRAAERVIELRFAEGPPLAADLVVFSAGIRPRDELARSSGLEVGERGGVAVDASCRTADDAVWAIGECAAVDGRVYGLVGPGYAMARVVADQLGGGDATFPGADMSTKLKLLGVDVASFGDAHGATPGSRSLTWHDPVGMVHAGVVLDAAGERVLGGVLVGDASAYTTLHSLYANALPAPSDLASLLVPGRTDAPLLGPGALPATARICSCNDVTKGAICAAVTEAACTSAAAVKAATRAGSTCGSCVPLVQAIIDDQLTRAGIEVDRSLCEHFAHTRQDLFDIVRVRRLRTFAALLEGWGRGAGCEICKPAVASMLASLWDEHVLDDDLAPLQDTNDRFLANLQRDGTYSVVPRVPAGEITPDRLIAIGEVARDFDLYTKITGGQRIDLFGARVDQLPEIWRRLRAAGLESGHAYGKSLRTVKSCVGDSWCRYGVQDSTSLAVRLELRYRGLRSPHKLKSAVSGCARECAEAQSKDFGLIATERGWDLYVCGNGGMTPRHATLLAEGIGEEDVIRYLDRFLMYYVRTADRLQRTAPWFEQLEGGIDHLRRVVVDDALGLAEELESAMARHVEAYRCEWAETLDDPAKVARFTHFANDASPDPDLAYVREREQRRPAKGDERRPPPVAVPVQIGGRR